MVGRSNFQRFPSVLQVRSISVLFLKCVLIDINSCPVIVHLHSIAGLVSIGVHSDKDDCVSSLEIC